MKPQVGYTEYTSCIVQTYTVALLRVEAISCFSLKGHLLYQI
jgi:hypothetical protein